MPCPETDWTTDNNHKAPLDEGSAPHPHRNAADRDKPPPALRHLRQRGEHEYLESCHVGPPGSVYESGTFVLYLDMEEGRYPLFAPQARFVTGIHHPNVNQHGRICHSIFDRN